MKRAQHPILSLASVIVAAALSTVSPSLAAADTTLELGIRRDAPPFAWEHDGTASGYSVALCDAVAAAAIEQRLYRDVKRVWVTSVDRFELLRSGQIDLLCDALTVTLHRMREFQFTLFTFVSGASYMHRAEDGRLETSDLARRTLGVLAGTTTQSLVDGGLSDEVFRTGKAAGNGALTIQYVNSHFAGLAQLLAGGIDVYVADREILLALRDRAQRDGGKELTVAERYFSFEPYALAMRREDVDLAFVANGVLVDLFRSNRINDVFAESFPRKRMSQSLRELFSLQRIPGGGE